MPYPAKRTVRRSLSGSSGGTGIKVISTSSAIEIHSHDSRRNQSEFDELHLWATNSHTVAVTLTLQWAGSTDPDNLLPISIASGSFLKIIDGLHIGGDLAVNAVAGVANKIVVYGYALSHVQEPPVSGLEYNDPEVVNYAGYNRGG